MRRFLLLCPASLVEQWQFRLRQMFDIRTSRYAPEIDTPRGDFWNTHDQVVASLQTLRADQHGRHERLLSADTWDLLIVDEAHHLNADEQSGPTLGYKLANQLITQHKGESVVFFTGTPHRGKDFGFYSLTHLLRPDLFDPRKPGQSQLSRLREVMIRNNKQNVTDMLGKPLFQPPKVTPETYQYSVAEARFYNMLTRFILEGKAYASGLSASDRRMVILVLIAMQKLASSSVAAIKRALQRRLDGIETARIDTNRRVNVQREKDLPRQLGLYTDSEAEGDTDATNNLEEELASAGIQLTKDEPSRLRELLAAASDISEETKVTKILGILNEQFEDRPVLFFTEYKATQSLLMSALIRRFGDSCVTFINGDEVAEDVVDSRGLMRSLRVQREDAADMFNSGAVLFLVSTEAGGEGIDLQERCHSLIHVDLPWNPMRLHQRVGRLNRYGQTRQVEVVHLRNPDTVEGRIWDKLNEKIENIMVAFGNVMDEPEDLLQLVLGMTSPSLFRELFSEATDVPRELLSEWFDQKTARFGGRDALDTVRELVGSASRFDFQQSSSLIPRVDLPALSPFLKTMLFLNGRQVRDDDEGLSFRTPEKWLSEPGVRVAYEHLIFDRQDRSPGAAERIVGVGHKAMDQAIRQARVLPASVASLPASLLKRPLVLFTVTDSITTDERIVRSLVYGVEIPTVDSESPVLLKDWEIIERLNTLAEGRGFRRARSSARPSDVEASRKAVASARLVLEKSLPTLDLPFRLPTAVPLAVLWPVTPIVRDPGTSVALSGDGLDDESLSG